MKCSVDNKNMLIQSIMTKNFSLITYPTHPYVYMGVVWVGDTNKDKINILECTKSDFLHLLRKNL